MNEFANLPATIPEEAGALRHYLHERHIDYISLAPLTDAAATIRFPGYYLGRDVVWDARLYALNNEANTSLRPRGVHSQFMEIKPLGKGPVAIVLGLAETTITPMVAHKAVIMVQNYKRLREGRHEYGSRVMSAMG